MGKNRVEKRKVIWNMIEKREDLKIAEKMLNYASSCVDIQRQLLRRKKKKLLSCVEKCRRIRKS